MPSLEELRGYAIDLDSGGGGSGSTVVTGLVTITIPWPGGVSHEEIVTFTGCTPAMTVIPAIAPHLDTDENDPTLLDVLALSAAAGSGQATIRAAFLTQTSGPIKLNLMAV